jgi:hypothetical protein
VLLLVGDAGKKLVNIRGILLCFRFCHWLVEGRVIRAAATWHPAKAFGRGRRLS